MQYTIKKNPEILALGSSRVMQIRRVFFENPDSFYNAGGAAASPAEMQCFLQQMKEDNELKLVLISIDQWGFNYNFTGQLKYPDSKSFTDPSLNKTLDFKNVMTNIIEDYIEQKLKISQLVKHNNRVGVNAKVKEDGFLNDGSYYYGIRFSEKNNPREIWFTDTYTRIENGNARFEYGEEINEQAVQQMENFLSYCKEKGIEVIGFEPPFSATVIQRLAEKKEKYQYMNEIPYTMKELFNEYQFEFYDYSDVSNLDCGDESFFVDGFHGGDIVYLKMFQDMIQQGSCLKKYCNESQLANFYNNRDSNVALYNSVDMY